MSFALGNWSRHIWLDQSWLNGCEQATLGSHVGGGWLTSCSLVSPVTAFAHETALCLLALVLEGITPLRNIMGSLATLDQ